jgi:SHS2 domain-containing protein
MSYTFLSHTADVKFRAEGNSLEEMFVSATDALNPYNSRRYKNLGARRKNIEKGKRYGKSTL